MMMQSSLDGDEKIPMRRLDESDVSAAQLAGMNLSQPNFKSYVDDNEARPHMTYYDADLTFKRPSFRDLQFKIDEAERVREEQAETNQGPLPGPNPGEGQGGNKFGTWDGVAASCLLNIFGVIMFLRLGWVVGQAGIGLAVVIIAISTVVTSFTTMSMSAIATNGEVKAGGAYYLISRAIGPQFGGAVGVLFSIGNAVAVALYIIGFCETLVTQLFDHFTLTGDELNDTRIYGLLLLTLLLCMALIGVGWVIKMQLGLLALLVLAILFFMIGTFLPAKPEDGFVGYKNFAENFGPDFQPSEGIDYDFFKTFAVFFPAVTGIMAGANISGDLKNPSKNIPLGTFSSIGISAVVYIAMAIMIGSVSVRSVPGSETVGLLHDNLIMVKVSAWGPMVLAGIYAATFSSALAALVGAPRILMSVAHDNLIPALLPFAKVRERDRSPIRGYFLTYFVAAACVCIGQLNIIAPLISMFFMMTYGLINFSCFVLSITKSPGWRPAFTAYSAWTALSGAVLCMVCMFLTEWRYAIMAVIVGACLYYYVDHRDPEVNWGSAWEAKRNKDAVEMLIQLRNQKQHVKTFRPSYLVLTGEPRKRLHLIRFAQTLKKGWGAMIFGNVTLGDYRQNIVDYRERWRQGYWEDKSLDIYGFLDSVIAPTVRAGSQALIQLSGLGALRPNTLLLGYKEDWADCSKAECDDYANVIRDAFKMRMGVMVMRGLQKIDWDAPPDPTGTVDVWWLLDDGGLSILIPYIMSHHRYWRENLGRNPEVTGKYAAHIRLMVVVSDQLEMRSDFQMISTMLSKFRIKWDLVVVETKNQGPSKEFIDRYEEMSPNDIQSQQRPEVTKRWIRVAELVHEHSSGAKMVYITMPFPRDLTASHNYMSWLEILSVDMKQPVVFLRGNGRNVLTFASE
eukprot:TRINITY_DN65737_c6_g1_i1.p1 TRINITY_DN65737_c6_g1~~TRINITY_DN65737_c6_g1_i1.p1  ORF type:complete len:905 (-),score=474.01 TRINITY_DN65737_c6_g1_i1:93-2807(-)